MVTKVGEEGGQQDPASNWEPGSSWNSKEYENSSRNPGWPRLSGKQGFQGQRMQYALLNNINVT